MNTTLAEKNQIKDRLETPYMSFWIEDDILYGKYSENVHVSLEVAKFIVERRIFFTKGNSYAALIDMRGVKSASREGRKYMATMGATLLRAGAIITGSKLNRALGNIFLKIDKPSIPTKLFTSEEKAKEWLQSYI